MFNITNRTILYSPQNDSTLGAILPHSDKVLSETDIDGRIDTLNQHKQQLSNSLAHRNTHGGKRFRAKRISKENEMALVSKKLELLVSAKNLVSKTAKALFEKGLQFKEEELFAGTKRFSLISCKKETKELVGIASAMRVSQDTFAQEDFLAKLDTSQLPKEAADHIKMALEHIRLFKAIDQQLNSSNEGVAHLGDLYIAPKFRGKGLSSQLIQKVSREVFSKTKTRFIAIAPDPFEYVNQVQTSLRDSPDYLEKRNRLIKLYQSQGFVPSKSDPFFMYLENPS